MPSSGIKILTVLDNMGAQRKSSFLRELSDFKKEFSKVKIRSYPSGEMHDRYIICRSLLCIVGHTLKTSGAKSRLLLYWTRNFVMN